MSEISSKARPEGEGQLPQRAFISRRASNLPGLDWQSRARKDRGQSGKPWPGRGVPEAHVANRAYPEATFYYQDDSTITHVD
jgi:hypothetical protein